MELEVAQKQILELLESTRVEILAGRIATIAISATRHNQTGVTAAMAFELNTNSLYALIGQLERLKQDTVATIRHIETMQSPGAAPAVPQLVLIKTDKEQKPPN